MTTVAPDYTNLQVIPINGSLPVLTENPGIARNRIISVSTDTLPVLATSGVADWSALSLGVKNVVITSCRVVSGTVPVTGNVNWRVRLAVDSANDAADALLLPTTTNPAAASTDIGQVEGFNVKPVYIPDYNDAGAADQRVGEVVMEPYYVDVSAPIKRLSFAHNIGGSVVLEFLVKAVEVV